MYRFLADSQRKHLDTLEAVRKAARGADAGSEVVDRASHFMNSFHEMLFAYDITKVMQRDRDAFDHVLQAEEEIIRLCEGMAKAEPNLNTKALLTWLAENEKHHLKEVEGIYDFVEAPDCYLEWGEFSNLRSL